MIHAEPHPLAGKTVTLNDRAVDPRGLVVDGARFWIEDYWDRVSGQGWGESQGNPAALQYAVRTAVSDLQGGRLPMDDEVVYGKIDGLGHLVHCDELGDSG